MKNNPFISEKFVSIWLKHFNDSKSALKFNFIKGVTFVKNKYLPLYINSGKNLTNGISYSLTEDAKDYKRKVFFLYDIPEYFEVNSSPTQPLKVKKIRQYKGYLANLEKYSNVDDFLKDNFSSKSKGALNSCKRRLELCFNIEYKMYYGNNISKETYDSVFKHFNLLLKKRYTGKQIDNHYLSQKKWTYVYELIYPLILEKKASLFVVYNENTPIAVSLCYVSPDNAAFGGLTVFDIDYSKFDLGFIGIMKQLEWCIHEKIKVLDYSKGDFEYKKRWGNKIYDFEYHIYYDSRSIFSRFLASVISVFFKSKQYLREQDLHTRFHKITFFLKGKKKKKVAPKNFEMTPIKNLKNLGDLLKIEMNDDNFQFLKEHIFKFLYRYSENINDINIYTIVNSSNSYIIAAKSHNVKITFDSKQQ